MINIACVICPKSACGANLAFVQYFVVGHKYEVVFLDQPANVALMREVMLCVRRMCARIPADGADTVLPGVRYRRAADGAIMRIGTLCPVVWRVPLTADGAGAVLPGVRNRRAATAA